MSHLDYNLSLKFHRIPTRTRMTDTAAAGGAAAGTDAQHINIKVKAQDGTEIFFKIKRSTQLKKLMDAYCTR